MTTCYLCGGEYRMVYIQGKLRPINVSDDQPHWTSCRGFKKRKKQEPANTSRPMTASSPAITGERKAKAQIKMRHTDLDRESQGGRMSDQHMERTRREIADRAEILRAGKAALCFSGGKDSTACLLLLRDYLADIHVLFVNPGHHYPETLKLIEQAKRLCPRFVEIKTDREAQWKARGLPSDIVPVDWTVEGQQFSGAKPVTIQSYLQYCFENLSLPMWRKAQELGCTVIIRGQRNDDAQKSPARTGNELEGMTFWHPIEHWTRWQTLDYVRSEQGKLPPHFYLYQSSLDCYDCPAYTGVAFDRANYTRTHHPELAREYTERMLTVYRTMREQINHYEAILGLLTRR